MGDHLGQPSKLVPALDLASPSIPHPLDQGALIPGFLGITDRWYAADTGASDVFAHKTPQDRACKTSSVSVTNGGIAEVEENEHKELMVRGTQLLPVGKAAKAGLRSFVWTQGSGAPVFSNLSPDKVRRINAILTDQPILMVRNNIPYCSPDEGLRLRKHMRGELAPTDTQGSEGKGLVAKGEETRDLIEDGFTVPQRGKKGPMPIADAPGWLRSLIAPWWSDAYSHVRYDIGSDVFVGPGGLSQQGQPTRGKSQNTPSHWHSYRKTLLFRRRGPDLRFVSLVGFIEDDLFDGRRLRNRSLLDDFDLEEIPDAPLQVTFFTKAGVHDTPASAVHKPSGGKQPEVDSEDAGSASAEPPVVNAKDGLPLTPQKLDDQPQQTEAEATEYYNIFTPYPTAEPSTAVHAFLSYIDNATPSDDLYRIRNAFNGAQQKDIKEFSELMSWAEACHKAAAALSDDGKVPGESPEYIQSCQKCGGRDENVDN